MTRWPGVLWAAAAWGVAAGAGSAAGATAQGESAWPPFEDVIQGDAIRGWRVWSGPEEVWAVKDGVLVCRPCDTGGWIGSTCQYADFIAEFEYLLPPGGNSGFNLRVPPGSGAGSPASRPSVAGIEVQLLDDGAPRHASLRPYQYTGSLYRLVAPTTRPQAPAGRWNRARIRAEGDRITVSINGLVVVDADALTVPELLNRPARGCIGLQNHHSGGSFRGIRVADLTADRMRRSAWWRQARFGMFIHWGVYAVLGRGEQIMRSGEIPAAEYDKLAPRFNPTAFDAAEWVDLARRAGQRYMVITAKHHDGLAMYDSKVTSWDVVDGTPFRRDPVAELAEACRDRGVGFGVYYSILDWHHPDYDPPPKWDPARRDRPGDFGRYLDFMRAQVRELCTGYGPLACMWWDGAWDHEKTPAGRAALGEINDLVRGLQPDILINNRAANPADFETPEQYIPPTGIYGRDGSPKLWENCVTLTAGKGSFAPHAWWGYDAHETEFKTPEFCIRMLADVASKGGNLLLNVGPTPEGRIRPEERRVLEAVGRWLEVHGQAIYGTTAGPFEYLPFFGRATVRDDVLYLIVFQWPADAVLEVPGLQNEVRAARLLGDERAELRVERDGEVTRVLLPARAPDPAASVVVLELDGRPRVAPVTIRPGRDGTVVLDAAAAQIRGGFGQKARLETDAAGVLIGSWTRDKDYATWTFEMPSAGVCEVFVEHAGAAAGAVLEVGVSRAAAGGAGSAPAMVDATSGGHAFEVPPPVSVLRVELSAQAAAVGRHALGRIEVPAGRLILVVRPVGLPEGRALMGLRRVELRSVPAAGGAGG